MKKVVMLFTLIFILNVIGQSIVTDPEKGNDKKRAISYQSQIKDDQGAVIHDGKYKVIFNLYDAENAEKPVWFENQNIDIKDGILNALIGSQKKLQPELFKDQLWMTIEINDEESDKQFVAASSYSMVAGRIDKDALVAGEAVLLSELPDGKIKIDIKSPPNNPVLYIGNIILYLKATGVEYLTIQNSLKADVGAILWNTGDAKYQGGTDYNDFVLVAKDGRDLVLKSDPGTTTGISGKVFVGTKTNINDLGITGNLISNRIVSELGKNIVIESFSGTAVNDPESPALMSTTGGNIVIGSSLNKNNMVVNGSISGTKLYGELQSDNIMLKSSDNDCDFMSFKNFDEEQVGSILWNNSSDIFKAGDDFEDFVVSAKNGRDLVLMAENGTFGATREVSVGTTTSPNDLKVTGNLTVTGNMDVNSINSKFLRFGIIDITNNNQDLIILNTDNNPLGGFLFRPTNPAWNGSDSGEYLGFYAENGRDVVIKSNKNSVSNKSGDVFIGTYSCPNNLYVYGMLSARQIVANYSVWPDYVFNNNYNLLPLNEIENHIKEHGRLPGMPSEKEVIASGVDLNQMQLILVEKIEELTLHMIRLEKENSDLRARIDSINK